MFRWMTMPLSAAALLASGAASAAGVPVPPVPVVTLSAAATASIPNDRMYASLRAEADHADPARAAADVNAKMAKALARAKATTGIDAKTSGYSSFQVADKKGEPPRWRVSQTLSLEGADFATMAALVSKLQSEDLLLSGMNFTVSPDARHRAEDTLTQQAIKAWQARAQNAARSFGSEAWRTGRVTIQAGDGGHPQPMYRMAAAPMAAAAPPVSIEGGNTEVTVTVSGEAVLEGAHAPK
ncbi:MAG: SIMPL domain-containing protein [Burkholderiales bacterium]|nr:SIMPL domain-containing protein [Burkholderiales bacterium]